MAASEVRAGAFKRYTHRFAVLTGGLALALGCFLLLPLLRAITAPPKADMELRRADTTELPPPPPPQKEEEKEEQEDEPPPPAPAADAPPLDLADLELVLNGGGFGDGVGAFAGSLPLSLPGGGAAGGVSDLFDMGGLEEKPQPVYRARPQMTREMRKRVPCTVRVVFTVTAQGRVVNPRIYSTDDPLFNDAALQAIRQWKFEPGKRKGKPDSFVVRQPITFQK